MGQCANHSKTLRFNQAPQVIFRLSLTSISYIQGQAQIFTFVIGGLKYSGYNGCRMFKYEGSYWGSRIQFKVPDNYYLQELNITYEIVDSISDLKYLEINVNGTLFRAN